MGATLADADPVRAGLKAEHYKDCLRRDSRVLPSEVRIIVTGIEMTDGRVFGDAEILESREQSRRSFAEVCSTSMSFAAMLPSCQGLTVSGGCARTWLPSPKTTCLHPHR